MPTERSPWKRALSTVALVVVAVAVSVPAFTIAHASRPAAVSAPVRVAATNFLSPYATGMPASLVLGQASMGTTGAGHAPTNFSDAESVAVSPAGDVFVTDYSNSRVLEFLPPFYAGEPASVALGQSNLNAIGASPTAHGMNGPEGLAFDGSGDLWVGDWLYCRVLEFVPPFVTGMAASLVIGHADFTTTSCSASSSTFASTNRIAFDPAGNLYVADSIGNRVLEFRPPFSNGMGATTILGQTVFGGTSGGTTAHNLSFPISLAATASMLFVGESSNARVLGFPLPAITGESATVVLGERNFTLFNGTGANVTKDPVALTTDPAGDLFAVDYFVNRVAEFLPPFTPFKAPSLVLGQSSLSGKAAGHTAANLTFPTGVALGRDGTLWVADSGNNRVVGYVPAKYAVGFQESGLPGGTDWWASLDSQPYLGGTTEILAPASNGTHSWTVGTAPPGYHLTSNATGSVVVNGSTALVAVAFAQNASAGTTGPLTLGLVVGIVVGVVAGVAVGLLLGRRRPKPRPAAVPPWSESTGAAPPPSPPPSTQGPGSGGAPPGPDA